MSKIKLPKAFEPPKELQLGVFQLEALGPQHNERDYEAWYSSREQLKGVFGPRNGWPGEVLSLEQNLEDLKRDYQEFVDKMTFRYAILNLDKTSYDGCLYIRPTSAAGYDCRVDLWLKNSKRDLEMLFLPLLREWFAKDWHFTNVAYPGRTMTWGEYYKLTD